MCTRSPHEGVDSQTKLPLLPLLARSEVWARYHTTGSGEVSCRLGERINNKHEMVERRPFLDFAKEFMEAFHLVLRRLLVIEVSVDGGVVSVWWWHALNV